MKDRKKALALELLTKYKEHAVVGKAILGVWNNREHLEDWLNPLGKRTVPIRISVVDSSKLAEIDVKNKDEVVIGGLIIIQKEDCSDLLLDYYITAIYTT